MPTFNVNYRGTDHRGRPKTYTSTIEAADLKEARESAVYRSEDEVLSVTKISQHDRLVEEKNKY